MTRGDFLKNPLRAFREALGLTRIQLAAAVGRSPETIERYEAEPPENHLAALRSYAESIGRMDLLVFLDPEADLLDIKKVAPRPKRDCAGELKLDGDEYRMLKWIMEARNEGGEVLREMFIDVIRKQLKRARKNPEQYEGISLDPL